MYYWVYKCPQTKHVLCSDSSPRGVTTRKGGGEKADKHRLSPVVKVNVTATDHADGTCPCYRWWWKGHLTSGLFLPKTHSPLRKALDKSRQKCIPQDTSTPPNCPGHWKQGRPKTLTAQEPQGTWQLNMMWDRRRDPGIEKGQYLQIKDIRTCCHLDNGRPTSTGDSVSKWQPGWQGSVGEEDGTYGWATPLCSWNHHNVVNWLSILQHKTKS